MDMTPTRTALYLRISRDRDGTSFGVDRQRTECEALADRLGWTVTRVFTDNDVSASTGRVRPQYEALLAAVEAGEVDGIIAWHTDRLHRRPVELERFIDIIDTHKVAVQTVRAGELDLTTESGQLVARMLGAVARSETQRAQARIIAQKNQAVARGDFRGGPRPFGYTADGMEVVPAEADMIRDAAQRLMDGATLRSLAVEWNARGSRTTKGNEWSPFAVKWTVLKYRNAGQIEHKGEPVGEASWPAIMPLNDLLALRAVLTAPGRRRQTGTARKWLGSGLFLCGRTGVRLMPGSTNGGVPTYRPYKPQRGSVTRPCEPVDATVNETMWRRLSGPDAAGWFDEDKRDDASQWSTERDGLQARLDEATALFASGVITGGQLGIISGELQGKIAELDTRIASAVSVPMLASVARADDVRAAWYALSVDARRTIIAALVTVVILPAKHRGQKFDPDLIDFRWHDPSAPQT